MTDPDRAPPSALETLRRDLGGAGVTGGAGAWRLDACGVTRSGNAIPALLHADAYLPPTGAVRLLLIGGLSGDPADVEAARTAAVALAASARGAGLELALSVIPVANPDGLAANSAPGNGIGGVPALGYPPVDGYFDDATNPESRYLWRWISFLAPDLALEVVSGSDVSWSANAAADDLRLTLGGTRVTPEDSLCAALGSGAPSGLAPIPGLRLVAPGQLLTDELERLVAAISVRDGLGPSPARRVLDSRRSRSPIAVARILDASYGHQLAPLIYTQGVAVSGRLRLAGMEGSDDQVAGEISAVVGPYVDGTAEPFADDVGGQHLAGLVWCEELAVTTGDDRYADLLIAAANKYRAGPAGVPPPPSDDNFRTEDMFFASAVLGRATALTGGSRYANMAAQFLVDADTQKPDGLFMHCRDAHWNWGRSNGFAALGYAELLTYLPGDHPQRTALLARHARQLDALLPLQQPDGTWLQVLDQPGSYHEFSVTCMVGYALARGIRLGWLDGGYRPALERAWNAASERIDDEAGLVDVCTGTGVQSSTREYLDRPAEFGFDHRGGSMALWFAVEVERLRRAGRGPG